MFGRKPLFDGVSSRDLLATFALSALGLLGLLPGLFQSESTGEPVVLMAWLAVAAPAIGCIGGKLRLRYWPLGFVGPAIWMGVYSVIAASLLHAAPTPIYAALVWAGLVALGWAIGVGLPQLGWGGPGVLLLASASLAGLSTFVTLLGDSASQSFIALAIDASPITCVMESAGLDWMRHASIYELAGSLPPDARTPYRGMLAGPLCLLVGWVLVAVAERRSRSGSSVELSTESSVGS